MRICLANTFDNHGGATVSAQRLAAGLRLQPGVEVDFIARREGADDRLLAEAERRAADGDSSWLETIAVENLAQQLINAQEMPDRDALFSATGPAWDFSGDKALAAADVVNLHWITRFLNHESLSRIHRAGKPIVWTLHDMRAFTGGCHYAGRCNGFEASCDACPQVEPKLAAIPRTNKQFGDQALDEIPVAFICPSNWLAGELRRSRMFQSPGKSVEVIPYGIDTECFVPADTVGERKELRRQFGISPESFCIIAGAANWQERRKGGAALQEAVARFGALWRERHGDSKPKPQLVLYGEAADSCEIDGVETIEAGVITGEPAMASLLKSGDLYLTMTREDNLPNTVMEALACGVPVAATAVGGIPDMVEAGVTGTLVERDDSIGMAAAILEASGDEEQLKRWSAHAREKAVTEYPLELQGKRYLELFRRLTDQQEKPNRESAENGGIDIIPSPLAADPLAVFGATRILEMKARLDKRAARIQVLQNRLAQERSKRESSQ